MRAKAPETKREQHERLVEDFVALYISDTPLDAGMISLLIQINWGIEIGEYVVEGVMKNMEKAQRIRLVNIVNNDRTYIR